MIFRAWASSASNCLAVSAAMSVPRTFGRARGLSALVLGGAGKTGAGKLEVGFIEVLIRLLTFAAAPHFVPGGHPAWPAVNRKGRGHIGANMGSWGPRWRGTITPWDDGFSLLRSKHA